MQKLTKNVVTIGPATETEEIIEQLINAGMNVARFNTKHSEPDWHNERIQRVRNVAKRMGVPVAVLLDLQGPEIRINLPEQKPFTVKRGEVATFTSDEKFDADNIVLVPQDVVTSMEKEKIILLEDGACEFFVIEVGATHFIAQALVECTVNHRKTLNTPGIVLNMPSLTDRDYKYLDGVKPDLIDFVGLSFVRTAQDVAILKEELAKRKIKAGIVSKIENQAALDNIDDLIEVSDAIMVARGDLGVEVPYQELIHWQKMLINKCREAALPVITATEMLKSMVSKPRPTRAEVSDVAHAIYDGTDAVMLSDETTIGAYPVKAVSIQATIANYNEPFSYGLLQKPSVSQKDTTEAITHAAYKLLENSQLQISKVVCLTETGKTVRLLSRFRLPLSIYAVTSNEETLRKMTLLYGVQPHMMELKESKIENEQLVIEKCKELGIVSSGETVLLIHGSAWKQPGLTNTLSIITIK